jgi:protein Tex
VKIRDIEEQLAYFRELISRRETILASISEQQKLTDELRHKIEATMDKGELEDLYLPYRPKRRTKATIARERGLEPLADSLWSQQQAERSLLEFAATFIDEAKQITTISEALEGARHIVAERIAETAEVRKALRQLVHDEGVIMSRKMMDAVDAQEKFKMYYEYREPVKTIPSHRMLAIRRGEAESILYFLIEVDPLRATGIVRRHILGAEGDWTPQLIIAIEDSWNRLLSSSIQSEVRLELKKSSDLDGIQVFRDNLNNLLLTPPAGPISVLGVDPGQRTGCKIAVVDETGKFLAHNVIYLHTGQTTKANQTLAQSLYFDARLLASILHLSAERNPPLRLLRHSDECSARSHRCLRLPRP